MSAQLTFDDAPRWSVPASRFARRRPSAHEQFLRFHAANPQVYATIVELAREARTAGKRRVGIGLLWEVMRWRMMLETSDPDGFKLNNNHRSRYARMVMEREPDLAGVFETRKLRTARPAELDAIGGR